LAALKNNAITLGQFYSTQLCQYAKSEALICENQGLSLQTVCMLDQEGIFYKDVTDLLKRTFNSPDIGYLKDEDFPAIANRMKAAKQAESEYQISLLPVVDQKMTDEACLKFSFIEKFSHCQFKEKIYRLLLPYTLLEAILAVKRNCASTQSYIPCLHLDPQTQIFDRRKNLGLIIHIDPVLHLPLLNPKEEVIEQGALINNIFHSPLQVLYQHLNICFTPNTPLC
jgi:hypothetical protein